MYRLKRAVVNVVVVSDSQVDRRAGEELLAPPRVGGRGAGVFALFV